MFTVVVFSLLAVLLVVAGVTVMSRYRHQQSPGSHPSSAARRSRKAQRAQSRHDRRQRH